MQKYFTIKAADYENMNDFGSDIVSILNRNFSNLSDPEKATIEGIEVANGHRNILTFPDTPFCGKKYVIFRNGKYHNLPGVFLGADGTIDPPEPGNEWEDGYWERTSNHQFGHSMATLDENFISSTKFFCAISGTSASSITVEITLDRYHKPQAAVCRLTTPSDYFGRYAEHFTKWAEAHNIVLKDGKW